MFRSELEIPFQQNISDNFLTIVNELNRTQEPGRIFNLTREPTKDELKFLINNYRNEIGLSRLNKDRSWKMIEGHEDRVNISPEIERISDIIAHYHPIIENLSTILPSLADVWLVNPGVKNFIISNEGMTYYSEITTHPIKNHPWKPSILIEEDELKELFRSSLPLENDKSEFNLHKFTETFLEKMGINIIKKSWQQLPDNPLSGFKI